MKIRTEQPSRRTAKGTMSDRFPEDDTGTAKRGRKRAAVKSIGLLSALEVKWRNRVDILKRIEELASSRGDHQQALKVQTERGMVEMCLDELQAALNSQPPT